MAMTGNFTYSPTEGATEIWQCRRPELASISD